MADVAPDLTPEQLQTLKRQLLKKGSEINDKLTALLNGQNPSINDILDAKPGETPIERLRRFMKLIDDRLLEVRNGTYGKCATCGAALPYVALHEVPWLNTCEACALKASQG